MFYRCYKMPERKEMRERSVAYSLYALFFLSASARALSRALLHELIDLPPLLINRGLESSCLTHSFVPDHKSA